MSLWHRIKTRLGLEDEWDEEYYKDEDVAETDPAFADDAQTARDAYESPYGGAPSVRRIERHDRARAAHLRSVPAAAPDERPAPQVKMHIAEPKSFGEAQVIADRFKQGTPVILNLTAAPPDVAKRLLDFASGLTYGLDGGLQKVAEKVFMLTPANVVVSEADKRRLQSSGLFQLPE